LLLTPIAAAAQGDAVAPATSPLASLQSRIAARLAAPEIQRGSVGIKVVSLDTGRVVFEQNGEKYFMPASNMKNFTVAAALERLGPEYRFPTIVYSRSRPGADGTVSGPLRVYGSGDVSISYTFNEDDHFRGIDRLADAIAAAGVKRVDGDIIADETYFKGSALPTGWEWDDLQFYYGAEVSALPVNDNVVRLSVTPGPAGYGCSVRLTPAHLLFRVENRCMTTPAGTPRTLSIHKKIGQNASRSREACPSATQATAGLFPSRVRQRCSQRCSSSGLPKKALR
jgi:serine-type D-Ala-D-Ala carboxypeptidase/endopeptidase (penicillin-binding protein 4)